MKKGLLALLLCAIAVSPGGSDPLRDADTLHQEDAYQEELSLLFAALDEDNPAELQGEIYWRLSRATLEQADKELHRDGAQDTTISRYGEGRELASLALDANPSNYLGYYWRSANLLRWIELKGLLESLDKAALIREDLEKAVNANPNHAGSWLALGELFRILPGLISFGNTDYAVSLARKGVSVAEDEEYEVFLGLARNLHKRDWSSRKRYDSLSEKAREYQKRTSRLEQGWFFEGTLDFSSIPAYAPKPLRNLSDREEALALMRWLKSELESRELNPREVRLLDQILILYQDWF